MSEFMSMGGYGVYIWSSYGVATVVLGGLLIASLRNMRRSEATVKSLRAEARAERGEADE